VLDVHQEGWLHFWQNKFPCMWIDAQISLKRSQCLLILESKRWKGWDESNYMKTKTEVIQHFKSSFMRFQNVSHITINRTDHCTKTEQLNCNKMFWLILFKFEWKFILLYFSSISIRKTWWNCALIDKGKLLTQTSHWCYPKNGC
jgi:hypothetical protein